MPHSEPRPTWQEVRLRKRRQIDAIWALASPRDTLDAILTADDVWTKLERANTERALQRIHRQVERKGRRIGYGHFRRRVDHLMSSHTP